jgi:hypothetical protein
MNATLSAREREGMVDKQDYYELCTEFTIRKKMFG